MAVRPGGSNPTRARILSAAASVLARRGYAGTRLADIAEAAGLRPPAVYYYFASRDEVVAATMIEGQRQLLSCVGTAVADLVGPAVTSLDRICAAVEAHLRAELELADFAFALSRNIGQLPPGIRQSVVVAGDEYHELWRQLLDAGVADGSVRGDLDIRTARMLIVGALNMAPEWWPGSRESATALVETAKTMVRAGLAVPR
ncbi:TetR/AcrR family transcriptional regulator [Skermania piniformis]|uniref:TetR/AcrR family transcriptional regulator n=1 Tax=Skermania pinensis TaxID=39122 RepID=A0ABX8S644_9ACTN|nr:TetR/AcrR family transcriptional regulator [Skermania piniformis]QXQ12926.1 TetR/AcrR family transcriptional regulator [Skermania piniformis]